MCIIRLWDYSGYGCTVKKIFFLTCRITLWMFNFAEYGCTAKFILLVASLSGAWLFRVWLHGPLTCRITLWMSNFAGHGCTAEFILLVASLSGCPILQGMVALILLVCCIARWAIGFFHGMDLHLTRWIASPTKFHKNFDCSRNIADKDWFSSMLALKHCETFFPQKKFASFLLFFVKEMFFIWFLSHFLQFHVILSLQIWGIFFKFWRSGIRYAATIFPKNIDDLGSWMLIFTKSERLWCGMELPISNFDV